MIGTGPRLEAGHGPVARRIVAVDLFAGAGGASEGIRRATGESPVLAVNHDAHAIESHGRNHSDAAHALCDVAALDPVAAVGRRPVDLLWGSPDCTHFSRAKGKAPRSAKIRALAWQVYEWARVLRPRAVCIENVPEFKTWGPLDEAGQPIPERAGEEYRRFLAALEALGYRVDVRVLCCADYGAPTIRRRLFLIARRDGAPVWPEPTHGPGRAAPWRTAAEIIDWGEPVPSIFERRRPLAPATLRRIAAGIDRYVLRAARPFLVCLTHGGRLERAPQEAEEPEPDHPLLPLGAP